MTASPSGSDPNLCTVCRALGVDPVPPPQLPQSIGVAWPAAEPALHTGSADHRGGFDASVPGTSTAGTSYWLRVILVGVFGGAVTVTLRSRNVPLPAVLLVIIPLAAGSALAFVGRARRNTAASFLVSSIAMLIDIVAFAPGTAANHVALGSLDPSSIQGLDGPFARLHYTVALLFETHPPVIIPAVVYVLMQGGMLALAARLLRGFMGAGTKVNR